MWALHERMFDQVARCALGGEGAASVDHLVSVISGLGPSAPPS